MRAVFRLRAAGHTILCIEYNQDILSRADWLVELGPGARENGGSITVGGAYAISDLWSVNTTYSFQGAKHNNSHNVNVGTTFRF